MLRAWQYALYNILKEFGFEYASTPMLVNSLQINKKDLYINYKKGYLEQADWRKAFIHAYGSDKLANYYKLTLDGFIALSKWFAGDPIILKAKKWLIKKLISQ